MQVRMTLTMVNAATILETRCLSFTVVRERYLPYGTLTARFLCDAAAYGSAKRVEFQLNGVTIHDGTADKLQVQFCDGQRILTVSSRGFSAAMLQNQPVPGLHTDVTLASLMSAEQLPYVTYETGITSTNYIFVPERSSLWETIAQFTYKLNGGYPFVRANNHVCVTPITGVLSKDIPTNQILTVGKREDTSQIISKIDMADATGDYGAYTASNAATVQRNLVRAQKIALDKRFLYQPQQALAYRIACSMRRQKQAFACYRGYLGEDIDDPVTIVGFEAGRVSRVEITGDAQGLRTQTTLYTDPFCNS